MRNTPREKQLRTLGLAVNILADNKLNHFIFPKGKALDFENTMILAQCYVCSLGSCRVQTSRISSLKQNKMQFPVEL